MFDTVHNVFNTLACNPKFCVILAPVGAAHSSLREKRSLMAATRLDDHMSGHKTTPQRQSHNVGTNRSRVLGGPPPGSVRPVQSTMGDGNPCEQTQMEGSEGFNSLPNELAFIDASLGGVTISISPIVSVVSKVPVGRNKDQLRTRSPTFPASLASWRTSMPLPS
ncbi:hypothetical protein TWF718_009717 [Orbilia javanica]|uniref:Uncharacterized protein n=1 Tax=Orbilia javanica TaxID=47235 RepID=A0AAN8RLM4_9PEZI